MIDDFSVLFSGGRHEIDSARFNLSRFQFCEISRSELESDDFLFAKVKVSSEIKKFRKTYSFKRFIESCVETELLLSLERAVIGSLIRSNSRGDCQIMSRMEKASSLLPGTASDRSKVIGSTQIPRGKVVSFNREDLSVSVHDKVQVEYVSGSRSSLKFKLPVAVSLAGKSDYEKREK